MHSLLRFANNEDYELYRDAAGKLVTKQGGGIAYVAIVKVDPNFDLQEVKIFDAIPISDIPGTAYQSSV